MLFFYPFVTEHYIKLSRFLNLHFNISLYFYLLVSSFRKQHYLDNYSLWVYFFWLKQYQQLYITFRQPKMDLFLSYMII